MKKVKIHWIDVAGNERMFITNVENANNNWHAISQTVEKLYKIHDYKTFQGVLEIEKIECIRQELRVPGKIQRVQEKADGRRKDYEKDYGGKVN